MEGSVGINLNKLRARIVILHTYTQAQQVFCMKHHMCSL